MRTRRLAQLCAFALLASCSMHAPSADNGNPSGTSDSKDNGSSATPSSTDPTGPSAASVKLPLVTPSVKAAAPKGFGGAMGHALPYHPGRFLTLSANDIKSRFFGAGPTNVYGLLGAIDERIQGYNARMQHGAPACMQNAPVAYTIHPFGVDVMFYAQCVEKIGSSVPSDPGFVQFATKDGVVYYYSAVGAGWTAAVLTPVTPASGVGATDGGTASTAYRVHAWSGVGYLNADTCGAKTGYDDCSYGVIELTADASTGTFELAVAGIGFGYCGAQLKSNGSMVYGMGSTDMGTECGDQGTFCVAASDVTTPAKCDGDAVMMLDLTPLGRRETAGVKASWAASRYPGFYANQVVLDGTATDSLKFGPTAPPKGVGSFE